MLRREQALLTFSSKGSSAAWLKAAWPVCRHLHLQRGEKTKKWLISSTFSLSSSLYCSFSGRTELGRSSAAETMSALRHAVWAMELLLPTQLPRSQHCSAVVRVPEATALHRTVKWSVGAVTESTALACSLHNSKSSKSSAPEIPQRQKLVPQLARQQALYFGRAWR